MMLLLLLLLLLMMMMIMMFTMMMMMTHGKYAAVHNTYHPNAARSALGCPSIKTTTMCPGLCR